MGNLGSFVVKIFVGILVGVMVLAFALLDMSDVFGVAGRGAVVTVGDEPIDGNDFAEEFRRELRRINEERGEGLTNEEAARLGLDRQVLDRMVTGKSLDIDAEDLGIGVDSQLARDTLREIPGYTNPITGELDLSNLDTQVRAMGTTRDRFEKDLIDGLRREQIVPAIVEGVIAPSDIARQRFLFLNEQRAADVLTLTRDSVPAPTQPTEAELKAWIDSNAELYTAPEYRRFELLRLEPFDFLPDVEVTEEELRQQYDFAITLPPSSQGSLQTEQLRTVAQIQLPDEATAKEAARRLADGEDAATVAASLGAPEPTVYRSVAKGSIGDLRVADAAFELEEGSARAVFGSLPFWYAVGVSSVEGEPTPTFAEARARVEEEVRRARALDLLFDKVDEIYEAMDRNADFESISDELGVPISIYDFLDRTGRTQDGLLMAGFNRIPGVATEDMILQEVFTNEEGYETDLIDAGDDGYFAVNVIDIIESQRRPLDEIRDRAVQDYLNDRIDTALAELATDIQSRIRAGETLEPIAAEIGIEPTEVVVVRTAPNPQLGPQIEVGLRDGGVGDAIRGPGRDAQTQQVAVLRRIQGTGDTLVGAYAQQLNAQARDVIASDLQTAYRAAILAENPVQQNDERIRQALGLDVTVPQ